MARSETFHCSIVTPEKAVFEEEVRFVAFPALDGEVGILPGRAPLLYRLGIGRFLARKADGSETLLFVDGGFAQMVDDRLTLLTEQAREISELDRKSARQELEGTRQPGVFADDRAYQQHQAAQQRARAQIQLSDR